MNEPFVPTTSNLYDVVIKCDSSTQVIFKKLEQTDVLRLMQLTRSSVIFKTYPTDHYESVSLVVSVHEDANGDNDK